MRVSVAMATYNGADHIREQLDSIAAQTRLPDEVVVSDDGSADGTLDIVRDWGAANPGIGLVVMPGAGTRDYNLNFLRAFARTTGDIVLPCDQDDVWLPEKIARMTAALEADPGALLAIHDLELTDGVLNPVGQRQMARSHAFGGPMRDYNVGMATAVRGPFLRSFHSLPPHVAYDNWMHACARELSAKIVLPDVLALYRRHGANASQNEVINAPGRRSVFWIRLAFLRRVLAGDRSGADLDRRAELLRHTAAWLDTAGPDLAECGLPEERAAAARRSIAEILAFTEARRAIRSRWRLARVLPVLSLLRRGDYRHANGWKAALKDIAL